jgi:hypothetical protein
MPYRSQSDVVNRMFYAMSAEDQESMYKIMAERARVNMARRPGLRLVADNSNVRRSVPLRDVVRSG